MAESDPNTANWFIAGVTTILGWLGWQWKRQTTRIDEAHRKIHDCMPAKDCRRLNNSTRHELQEAIQTVYTRLNEIQDDNVKRSERLLVEIMKLNSRHRD